MLPGGLRRSGVTTAGPGAGTVPVIRPDNARDDLASAARGAAERPVATAGANAASPADRWRQALLDLTANEQAAAAWRRERYAFAHCLGSALTAGTGTRPALNGSVLYGVWLAWGLLYIGQTSEVQRRLRDLAVGESHHLANTYPPEIWSRVVVIAWPQLPAAAPAIERLSEPVVGLALEHRLQAMFHPLANASRRTPTGGWRRVDWSGSRSRGSDAAGEIDELFSCVKTAWDAAEAWAGERDDALPDACRVVFLAGLLQVGA